MNQIITGSAEQAFQKHLQRLESKEPEWLLALRREAFAHHQELGWPTRKHEDWRFTSVKSIAGMKALPAMAPPAANLPLPDFVSGCRLVFVNGFLNEELSALDQLPAGIRLQSLQQVIREEPARLQAHFNQMASFEGKSFHALNTAFFQDGLFLCVDPGARIAEPIHLVYLAVEQSQPFVVHPRHLIIAGAHSECTLTETYIGESGTYWSNRVGEILVEAGARVNHHLLCREADGASQVGSLGVIQHSDSQFTTHQLLFGGALLRNNCDVVLAGTGADVIINGLFMANDQQHMDTAITVDHAVAHCTSDQYVKGILDEAAHGVFNGAILVRQDAQKTDARQTNRNMLLSGKARVDTKPRLEIYADDVKCAHGATTGQIDEEALFYLQTRGLAPKAARDLLLYAFAHEIIDRLSLDKLKNHAEQVLYRRFETGHLLGGVS